MAPRLEPVEFPHPDNDRGLFVRVRLGDDAALAALFDRYVDALCSFAFAYAQSRDSAEEIVQDVFIWIWEHRTAIEPPRSVPSYLYTAVRNRALNQLRARATEVRFYEREATEGGSAVSPRRTDAPDALAEAHDLRDAAARAVAELPLRCREVFTLARGRQLTYAEIADVLGISPKTVEIHMSRALAHLRERLAPWLSS
ncbi:MAG TPA: RNA polymerase sigma-70 factor [Gemmatimonadaceae bacterium]|nr:RNA polymerase sigma-70 factor [Gemmatimonadaceae bacterium]